MSNLQNRQNSKILAAFYIVCFALAVVLYSGFGSSNAKAITLVTVILAAAVIFITADFNNLGNISGFMVVYGIWLTVVLVYSFIIWILNFETVSYMMRGCSKIVFQFIMILNIFAAAYLFGEKGIHYMFWGLALGNLAIALVLVPRYPISEIVSSVTVFLTQGGTAEGYMKGLEIHDVTFTYGFFLIYFIFFDKISSKKMKVINIILALFLFGLGFKRIAIASCFLMLLAAWGLEKLTPRVQFGIMKTILICGVIFSFLYLFSIKYNIFMMIMDKLGVDVMGRNVLYGAVDKYYKISPTYIGHGFEYVHMMMAEIRQEGGKAFNGMIDLHNDFMRVYIEMGFWGFFAWGWYTLIFQYNWIKSKFGLETVRLFFLCELYIFLTYMTDNTLFYFYTGTVLRLIPMCYALHIGKENSLGKGKLKRKLVVLNDGEKSEFEILSKRGEESVTLYKKKLNHKLR